MNKKVEHEIHAALIWLEEGEVERVRLHLAFALAHLNDDEAEQKMHPTLLESPRNEYIYSDNPNDDEGDK